MDGTVWIVKRPFVQLASIHAFFRHDEWTKQVPLAFILMADKSTQDYEEVGIS